VESEAKLFSGIRNEQQSSIIEPVTSSGLSGNVEVNTVKVSTTTAIRTNAETTRSTALDIPVKTETPQMIAQVKEEPVRERSDIQTEELKTEQVNTEIKPSAESVKVKTTNVTSVNVIRTNPELTKSTALDIPVKREADQITAQVRSEPVREKTKINTEEQKVETIAQKPTSKTTTGEVKTTTANVTTVKPIRTNPEIKKSEGAGIPVKTEIASTKPNVLPENKKSETVALIAKTSVPQKSLEEITAPAKNIGGRNSEFAQTVNFKSDSLELSLYDNGEIDGDTVSVFMNGVPIMSRQGLKASAIKKTIYLAPGTNDEFTLVLFAENLGKYPPNTGLLVVHDGDDVYNVRFSADYQKNAGVVFRRKK
jgi:hypothetical protein